MRNALFIILLLIVATGFAYAGYKFKESKIVKKEPRLSSEFISGKIREVSDLIAAELIYSGMLKVTQGQIPFITEKGFTMTYSANIRSSIDISKILIEVNGNNVSIQLPDSVIHSIDVDPDSINFYDNKYSLFNWHDKGDVVEAIRAAKADAEKNADIELLKRKAEKNARKVLSEVLSSTLEAESIQVA